MHKYFHWYEFVCSANKSPPIDVIKSTMAAVLQRKLDQGFSIVSVDMCVNWLPKDTREGTISPRGSCWLIRTTLRPSKKSCSALEVLASYEYKLLDGPPLGIGVDSYV